MLDAGKFLDYMAKRIKILVRSSASWIRFLLQIVGSPR